MAGTDAKSELKQEVRDEVDRLLKQAYNLGIQDSVDYIVRVVEELKPFSDHKSVAEARYAYASLALYINAMKK